MPVSGTWIALIPAECGSSSASRSRPMTSQATPLAWPLSKIRSMAGSSDSSSATMTLPQIS